MVNGGAKFDTSLGKVNKALLNILIKTFIKRSGSYLFFRTRKRAISNETVITAITTTRTAAIVPDVIPAPVRASSPPTGGGSDLELARSVGLKASVPTEKTICDGVVVGAVTKGSFEGITVGDPVVLPVNECEGWVLVVMGAAVDGALVLLGVDSSVGAGAGERRSNEIR